VAAIAGALARLGTTSLLPTLISAHDSIPAALAATAAAIEQGVPGVLGLHIEGPFINPVRRGIHPERNIAALREDDVALLAAPHPGIRLMTVAPERIEAAQLGQLARAVVLFAGHSDATCEQAEAALRQGVSGFTHLFNAMSQFGSRAPGCVGAAMAHARACASIICDGLHVHPAGVRAAYHAMGRDRLFFVSDCMPTVGGPADRFTWDGETILLRDGRLTTAGATLAGAHVTMAECVERAVRLCGIPLPDALRMATATPARYAGAHLVGRLAPGCRADMVALDEALAVQAVWQGGRRCV
jgi:N-acetylglucosamine-6-phosphate deacetylase